MLRKFVFVIALVPAISVTTVIGRPVAHASDLELSIVMSRVVAENPRLAVYENRKHEAEARVVQADLLPNPNLSTEVENVAGSGDFKGTDEAETTIMLSQEFELGGKRSRRRHAAELDTELAEKDYDRVRASVLREASMAFIDVLAEQQLLELVDEAIELTNRVLESVRRRVNAGSVSRVELARAEISHSRAQLQRRQQVRLLSAARLRLAATWGAVTPDFERVAGSFGDTGPIPTLEELRNELDANPEIVRWRTETARREALVELERSRAIPDVTVAAGYRRLSGPDDDVLVAQFSVPLPLFDRNQGAIDEARFRVLRADNERRVAEIDLLSELIRAHETLTTARAEGHELDEVILPYENQTFESLRDGFREGRFKYLEVLDAQRSLVATRSQRVRTFADYYQAVATIEWLTGKPLTAGLDVAAGKQELSQ
jgi:cobalt-zinc-cadmium efflux system outer membrane protein